MKVPKVSVCIITHNQESFIKKCVDSVLSQVVQFEIEILISDDASTDKTWDVIEGINKKYPEKIKAYRHQNNIGGTANYKFIHSLARGEYVAHLDGDDYLLPEKLQAQHDILDLNKNCNIVLHAVDKLLPGGRVVPSGQINQIEKQWKFSAANLISRTWIGAHSSKMYRRSYDHKMLPESALDFFIILNEMKGGYGIFLADKAYGVYRVGVGVSVVAPYVRELMVNHLKALLLSNPEYRSEISSAFIYMLISAFKNRSTGWVDLFKTAIQCLSFGGVVLFIANLNKVNGNKL